MNQKSQPCPICEYDKSDFIINTPVQMKISEKIFSFHKCSNCKCIFLFNPPNIDEICAYYDADYLPYSNDENWGKYKSFIRINKNFIDKKRVKLVLKNFNHLSEKENILDFGCGEPSFLMKLNQITKVKCVGFDINNYGWNNKEVKYNKIELISGNREKINLNTKFNIVTLWHSLEHDFQPRNLINFLNIVTTDNAILIVEVPNYSSLTRCIQKKYWAGYHTPRHSVIYTKETLQRLLKGFGWKVEKVYKYGTMDSFTLWWLGHFEKKLRKNTIKKIQLEKYFLNFVFLKFLLFPFFLLDKLFSFGIITVVFKKEKVIDEK